MKTKLNLGALAGLLLATAAPQATAAYPVTIVGDPYEVQHTLMNKAAWAADRIEQLNQLTEMVTNNQFNQIMQDVMGTVNTLASTPMKLFNDIQGLAGGVMGLFNAKSWLGSFESIFSSCLDPLKNLSLAQIGDSTAGSAYINQHGGAFGFMNQIGGMRTALNTAYLEDSKAREQKFKSWEKEKYGKDAIQMQSTQIDILKNIAQQQARSEEMAALDRVYESAERAAVGDQLRARRNKTMVQTQTWHESQLKF